MLTILVFIIILGLLIFVHELGHFLTARRNGIKVEEFGFGFPPRLVGFVRNNKKGKFKIIWGSEEVKSEETVYSVNWIPLGGFVKIKGENRDVKGEDSFSSKGAWVRTKVLAAGVIMNFILAWALFSFGFIIGMPEGADKGDMITITRVVENTPASEMGLKFGDEILKKQIAPDGTQVSLSDIKSVQDYISSYKGREVDLKIRRGSEYLSLKGTPRFNTPEGQGSLGIELADVSIIRYTWYEAIWLGLLETLRILWAIVYVISSAIASLFTGAKVVGLEVAGPVKIFGLTKDFVNLGLIYVVRFAAILSVNLGLINILPIPALDGGRILFILIEKIKGKPVDQKVESFFHTIFFILLILLMVTIILLEAAGEFAK